MVMALPGVFFKKVLVVGKKALLVAYERFLELPWIGLEYDQLPSTSTDAEMADQLELSYSL